MLKTGIIGPNFFYEPAWNGENYQRTLWRYAMLKILHLPGSPSYLQDGNPRYWTIDVDDIWIQDFPELD